MKPFFFPLLLVLVVGFSFPVEGRKSEQWGPSVAAKWELLYN